MTDEEPMDEADAFMVEELIAFGEAWQACELWTCTPEQLRREVFAFYDGRRRDRLREALGLTDDDQEPA